MERTGDNRFKQTYEDERWIEKMRLLIKSCVTGEC